MAKPSMKDLQPTNYLFDYADNIFLPNNGFKSTKNIVNIINDGKMGSALDVYLPPDPKGMADGKVPLKKIYVNQTNIAQVYQILTDYQVKHPKFALAFDYEIWQSYNIKKSTLEQWNTQLGIQKAQVSKYASNATIKRQEREYYNAILNAYLKQGHYDEVVKAINLAPDYHTEAADEWAESQFEKDYFAFPFYICTFGIDGYAFVFVENQFLNAGVIPNTNYNRWAGKANNHYLLNDFWMNLIAHHIDCYSVNGGDYDLKLVQANLQDKDPYKASWQSIQGRQYDKKIAPDKRMKHPAKVMPWNLLMKDYVDYLPLAQKFPFKHVYSPEVSGVDVVVPRINFGEFNGTDCLMESVGGANTEDRGKSLKVFEGNMGWAIVENYGTDSLSFDAKLPSDITETNLNSTINYNVYDVLGTLGYALYCRSLVANAKYAAIDLAGSGADLFQNKDAVVCAIAGVNKITKEQLQELKEYFFNPLWQLMNKKILQASDLHPLGIDYWLYPFLNQNEGKNKLIAENLFRSAMIGLVYRIFYYLRDELNTELFPEFACNKPHTYDTSWTISYRPNAIGWDYQLLKTKYNEFIKDDYTEVQYIKDGQGQTKTDQFGNKLVHFALLNKTLEHYLMQISNHFKQTASTELKKIVVNIVNTYTKYQHSDNAVINEQHMTRLTANIKNSSLGQSVKAGLASKIYLSSKTPTWYADTKLKEVDDLANKTYLRIKNILHVQDLENLTLSQATNTETWDPNQVNELVYWLYTPLNLDTSRQDDRFLKYFLDDFNGRVIYRGKPKTVMTKEAKAAYTHYVESKKNYPSWTSVWFTDATEEIKDTNGETAYTLNLSANKTMTLIDNGMPVQVPFSALSDPKNYTAVHKTQFLDDVLNAQDYMAIEFHYQNHKWLLSGISLQGTLITPEPLTEFVTVMKDGKETVVEQKVELPQYFAYPGVKWVFNKANRCFELANKAEAEVIEQPFESITIHPVKYLNERTAGKKGNSEIITARQAQAAPLGLRFIDKNGAQYTFRFDVIQPNVLNDQMHKSEPNAPLNYFKSSCLFAVDEETNLELDQSDHDPFYRRSNNVLLSAKIEAYYDAHPYMKKPAGNKALAYEHNLIITNGLKDTRLPEDTPYNHPLETVIYNSGGGCHGAYTVIVKRDNNLRLVDPDKRSFYPTTILQNPGIMQRLDPVQYLQSYNLNITLKKTDPMKREGAKRFVNGATGIAGEVTSQEAELFASIWILLTCKIMNATSIHYVLTRLMGDTMFNGINFNTDGNQYITTKDGLKKIMFILDKMFAQSFSMDGMQKICDALNMKLNTIFNVDQFNQLWAESAVSYKLWKNDMDIGGVFCEFWQTDVNHYFGVFTTPDDAVSGRKKTPKLYAIYDKYVPNKDPNDTDHDVRNKVIDYYINNRNNLPADFDYSTITKLVKTKGFLDCWAIILNKEQAERDGTEPAKDYQYSKFGAGPILDFAVIERCLFNQDVKQSLARYTNPLYFAFLARQTGSYDASEFVGCDNKTVKQLEKTNRYIICKSKDPSLVGGMYHFKHDNVQIDMPPNDVVNFLAGQASLGNKQVAIATFAADLNKMFTALGYKEPVQLVNIGTVTGATSTTSFDYINVNANYLIGVLKTNWDVLRKGKKYKPQIKKGAEASVPTANALLKKFDPELKDIDKLTPELVTNFFHQIVSVSQNDPNLFDLFISKESKQKYAGSYSVENANGDIDTTPDKNGYYHGNFIINNDCNKYFIDHTETLLIDDKPSAFVLKNGSFIGDITAFNKLKGVDIVNSHFIVHDKQFSVNYTGDLLLNGKPTGVEIDYDYYYHAALSKMYLIQKPFFTYRERAEEIFMTDQELLDYYQQDDIKQVWNGTQNAVEAYLESHHVNFEHKTSSRARQDVLPTQDDEYEYEAENNVTAKKPVVIKNLAVTEKKPVDKKATAKKLIEQLKFNL